MLVGNMEPRQVLIMKQVDTLVLFIVYFLLPLGFFSLAKSARKRNNVGGVDDIWRGQQT